MLRPIIYFLILVSLVISSPVLYQQFTIWNAQNPLDDGSFFNQWLLPFTASVSPSVVMRDIKEGREPVIIDVRTKEEFDKGHIPGAISIPQEDLHKEIPGRLKNKLVIIYIYCNSSGFSGAVATRLLHNMNYFNTFNIDGGLKAWEKDGFEVEDTLF